MTIQQDRDVAVKVVEAACADGVIIEADRDQRIVQLQGAQSQAEIDVVLGNLKGRATPPEPPEPPEPPQVPLSQGPNLKGLTLGSGRTLPFGALLGGLVTVVAGIAFVVFLVNLLSGVDSDPVTGGPPSTAASPERPSENQGTGTQATGTVISEEGWADLLAAIKKATGSTAVFDATLYPKYAVLQLPYDRESQRQVSYYWDGEKLDKQDSFGRSSDPRLDLATVNFKAALRLSRRVTTLIENPNSYYLIFNAPDKFDGAVMYAYATNKFSEGGYISADANGKRIRKVTW